MGFYNALVSGVPHCWSHLTNSARA